ncbi:tyrosine-protein phosphatase [Pedobacter cryoconitis]|uniref:protein-tyrosine-phosphatase n=1 Tax=Pedobacter cryoconitis TaxID=188932 RepID=A0A7X0MKW0_9SPHI|nr:CpsB/CapC family capsule biosynthesis tyrosine phosphatase [Pedobacter cryoconitis]MBB6500853.1 tyrosine-protein phosphatase YwqE [Pedobacter cryoconitis]
MFSFFTKKTQVDHIEWLGVDMHSHLLPGIDDGAADIIHTVGFIKKLRELGFHKLLCTPHVFTELYPNTPETIKSALNETQLALQKTNLDIEIGAAAEYMINDTFKVSDQLLCLPGRHLLIEMSYLAEMPDIEKIIFDLQLRGYIVILAHPERYNFYFDKHQRFHRLKDIGVLFQLNLLSLSGYYGKEVKKQAEYLIQKNYYELAGTDLHHEKHLEILTREIRSGRLFHQIGHVNFRNKELFV